MVGREEKRLLFPVFSFSNWRGRDEDLESWTFPGRLTILRKLRVVFFFVILAETVMVLAETVILLAETVIVLAETVTM